MLAAPTPGFDIDRGPLAKAGKVFDNLFAPPKAYNAIFATVLAVGRLIGEFDVNMEVVISFNHTDQIEVIQLQKVHVKLSERYVDGVRRLYRV
jgi:hypothetical protein